MLLVCTAVFEACSNSISDSPGPGCSRRRHPAASLLGGPAGRGPADGDPDNSVYHGPTARLGVGDQDRPLERSGELSGARARLTVTASAHGYRCGKPAARCGVIASTATHTPAGHRRTQPPDSRTPAAIERDRQPLQVSLVATWRDGSEWMAQKPAAPAMDLSHRRSQPWRGSVQLASDSFAAVGLLSRSILRASSQGMTPNQ
jgi:hypothetical protein